MKNSLSKGYFIVGTDTDIGKTYVSSVLYKSIAKFEKNIFYYKPLQTGCYKKDGEFVPLDPKFLCDFNNIELKKEMTTYLFENPLSPHLAMEIEGREIEIEKIIKQLEELKERYETGLIETAGGIYVPIIREKFNMYDLIKLTDLPVILVTSTKVGTINHTMLTVDFLRNKGIKIQGIIFNNFTNEFYEEDNIKTISEMSRIENYLILEKDEKEIEQKKLLKFLNINL